MTFTVQEPVCEVIEPDSADSEGEDEFPLVSCDISVTCKSVEMPEGAEDVR